jgi:hypothetical protein
MPISRGRAVAMVGGLLVLASAYLFQCWTVGLDPVFGRLWSPIADRYTVPIGLADSARMGKLVPALAAGAIAFLYVAYQTRELTPVQQAAKAQAAAERDKVRKERAEHQRAEALRTEAELAEQEIVAFRARQAKAEADAAEERRKQAYFAVLDRKGELKAEKKVHLEWEREYNQIHGIDDE